MARLVLLTAGEVRKDLAHAAEEFGVPLGRGNDLGALARTALDEGVERLVIAGGDGSVHQVANAVHSARPADSRPELAIVPTGTANDLATALDVPREPIRAFELAVEGRSRPIDVGRVGDEIFVNALSFGVGAHATRNAPPELKRLVGSFAYLLSGLVEFGGATPRPLRLSMPDETLEGHVLLLSLCNSGRVGGVPLVPAAELDDGRLDLVALVDVHPDEPGALLAAARALVEGEAAAARHVWSGRAARFGIDLGDEASMTVNLDGEPSEQPGCLEVVVEPAALHVVAPR